VATTVTAAETWKAKADNLTYRAEAFIDGEFRPALSGVTFPCMSPVAGQRLADVAECRSEDVDRAVVSARRAFEDGVWSEASPATRRRVLLSLARLMEEHKDELALLITVDMGKPISYSLREVDSAIACIEFYGEAIDKVFGEIAPTDVSALALVSREPIGVVAAVIPWNYPLLMPAWKLGPALATGNAVVVKPAEQSPLVALKIAELALEAGVPAGVLNVLPGFGETAGAALGLHPGVDSVTFTGSTQVGRLFLKYAGDSNMKSVSLETGGKSPVIVFQDTSDLDFVAESIVNGIFINQGEMCNACSRVIVDNRIREAFLERVVTKAAEWSPNDPFDPATRMGALVDETQLKTVLSYIEVGKQEGARLRLGGAQVLENTGGYYVEPTVFDDVSNDMRIAQEEIFGPVLSVIGFQDPADAVTLANDSMYGLAAAVWTRDVTKAHKVARALRAGNVYVNCYNEDNMSCPFGGYKQSGIGRDKSLHAMEKYTQLKMTWINLDR